MIAKNMEEFHLIVCSRDGYICQVCGKCYDYPYYFNDKGINQHVCGHHVKTQGSSPESRLETDNGRCVDFNCHTGVHNGTKKLM